MRPIPTKIRKQIDADLFYKTCIRVHEGDCSGRITIEHSLIVAGRQCNELFALLPLCWSHHLVHLDKRYNEWVALNRATDAELLKYAKANWIQKRNYLNTIYGTYTGRT